VVQLDGFGRVETRLRREHAAASVRLTRRLGSGGARTEETLATVELNTLEGAFRVLEFLPESAQAALGEAAGADERPDAAIGGLGTDTDAWDVASGGEPEADEVLDLSLSSGDSDEEPRVPPRRDMVKAALAFLRDQAIQVTDGTARFRVHAYRDNGTKLWAQTFTGTEVGASALGALAERALPDLSVRAPALQDAADLTDHDLAQRLGAVGNAYVQFFDLILHVVKNMSLMQERQLVRADREIAQAHGASDSARAHLTNIIDKMLEQKREEVLGTSAVRQLNEERETRNAMVQQAMGSLGGIFQTWMMAKNPELAGIGPEMMAVAQAVNTNPQLKAALADPRTVALLSNPEFASGIAEMLGAARDHVVAGASATPEKPTE